MQSRGISFLGAIFLCSQAVAMSQSSSSAPAASQTRRQISASSSLDCAGDLGARREAGPVADRDQSARAAQSDPAGVPETAEATPAPIDLDQDMRVLEQKQNELAQCILAAGVPEAPQDSPGACFGELVLDFEMRHDGEPERDIPIGRLPGSTAFFYESGMTIDADGAPNAYHPDNVGLDDLANAGAPGNWQGLAKDSDGEPFVQGPDDPFPGYYVSATALADRSKPVNDPTRYVDASKIPFIVLPGGTARELGARPGDLAVVFNRRNGKSSYAIFGDVGPPDRIGEGSMALAENLGIRSDARNGGARRGILYLVFPGSGNGRPRTVEEINAEGQTLLQGWEGSIPLTACAEGQPAPALGGNQSAN
jgi:Fungal chitosanase of glycosyl hydrolase group 75